MGMCCPCCRNSQHSAVLLREGLLNPGGDACCFREPGQGSQLSAGHHDVHSKQGKIIRFSFTDLEVPAIFPKVPKGLTRN